MKFGFVMPVIGLVLAGCSALPRSGPDHREIASVASGTIADENKAPALPYALVDLSTAVISNMPEISFGSIYASFGGGRGPAPDVRVAYGDQLQITIFEAGKGGLFIPETAGVRPGNFVTLPSQVIERSGTLSVPYAGNIPAVGRNLRDIQTDIVTRLSNRAIEPQVIVSFVERAAEVAVVGELNAPNKLKVNFGGDRVLDMISRAGGLRYPAHESFVTLHRRGKKATVHFNRLVQSPEENIFVSPNDTVYVFRTQRFFLAIGASGLQGRFDFDAERLFLADGVGKAGGLLDSRADPGQIFLYRTEDRKALARSGVNLDQFPPDQKTIPTIYRVNMREPQGLFLAQKLVMRDRDIIYVSNADQVELSKFLSLVNEVSGTAANVSSDVRLTRDSIRALRR